MSEAAAAGRGRHERHDHILETVQSGTPRSSALAEEWRAGVVKGENWQIVLAVR